MTKMHSNRLLLLVFIILNISFLSGQKYSGYFNFEFEESSGKLMLEVSKLNQDFLMVNGYGTGIGSNDLGMDRGKLNDTRVVRFEKHGDKILLVQPNLGFRAISTNSLEVKAVSEAFAQSVIYGFKIEKSENGKYYIDLAPMLYEDLNFLVTQLKETKQGTYKLEKSRSALYFENTHSFPKNSEFESILTFIGDATGSYIKSVVPTPEYVSYRQHVSFIELPDDQYQPRVFHPESGYFYSSYFDYATPIHEPIEKKFINRHRLTKKNPNLEVSEAVKPIVYYFDPGCPEPIKSALMEGGRWWSQAFEAAGFSNAFLVEELPAGAHAMDVRYNMVQWVHRSTRGWSYGSSIRDPRTGEIMKGHVSLGSLRVRQDFMIAQGILSPYQKGDEDHKIMTEMALKRLMQLSAHEIGHTIGLAHNFAASVNDRASVMDYPHPYITLDEKGNLDFTNAYDNKIGIWDKRAITYGYKEFGSKAEESEGLRTLIIENQKMGLKYLTDQDGRGIGSASPHNHVWDNGSEPIAELQRISKVRSVAMKNFGLNTIPLGTPISELEKILVPVYLMHRYQIEAVSKLIGGLDYTYAVKGFGKIEPLKPIDPKIQDSALDALLQVMTEEYLLLPEHITQYMFPPADGYPLSRESFLTQSSPAFDATSVYESAVSMLLDVLMQPQRLQRLENGGTLNAYLSKISLHLVKEIATDKIKQIANIQFILRLHTLKHQEAVGHMVRVALQEALNNHSSNLHLKKGSKNWQYGGYMNYLGKLIRMDDEDIKNIKLPQPAIVPPGAPIGNCSME
jgi:hypothetical protein